MQKLKNLSSEWFDGGVELLNTKGKIFALLQLFFSYLPFLIIFSFTAPMWVDGDFNVFQLLVLTILLLFSFYLQSQLNYGIFPKWDYCAKLVTFPFFVVLRMLAFCIGRVWAVLEVVVLSIVSLALQLGLIALVIFICIGLFGVLLFGFRQVF